MKTIAIDIRLIGKGRTGDETVFFHLTKALLRLPASAAERRYHLLTDERDPAALAVLRGRLGCIGRSDVEIRALRASNRFVWNLWSAPWYLWCHRIDIYHTQYILPFFLPKLTRALTLIHDVSFLAFPEFIAPSDRFFLKILLPRSLKQAAHILTPSVFTRNEIEKYYGIRPEKITVIPNAAQDIFSARAEGDTIALRKKYHLPEKYFLYVGTLQPRKNIPFLLEAFAHVRARLPQAKLVLVGNKNAHNIDQRIDQTIERHGLGPDVVFPGYVSEKDLPLLVREARVFVFPTLYEGFGIPLLEAMSQEVPVVATAIPSLVETGGEAFARIPAGDIAKLAENMYTSFIVPEFRNRLIEAGKKQAALYSWENSAKKLLDVYRTL